MRNNNDTAAGLGADGRMFNMPINQMCGTVYMKEEDIQTQPTVSEGEVNEREEDMNTNARGRPLDTGRVLSFRFSQPSVRAGSPCDHSLSHGRGGYFVANETPGPRAGCPVRDNPPTWVESQSGRCFRGRPPSLTDVKMQGEVI